MIVNKKKDWVKKYFLWLLSTFFLIFMFVIFVVGDYDKCVGKNLKMCLTSNKYVFNDLYSFRYPRDYPTSSFHSSPTKKENIIEPNSDATGIVYENLNFSKHYYANAGGDRLAFLNVEKTDLLSVEEYIKKEEEEFNNIDKEFKEKYNIAKPAFDRLLISGEEAIVQKIEPGASSFSPTTTTYIFFHNGLRYRLSFYYNSTYHKQPVKYYDDGKEIILSTFKFLN